MLKRILVVDDKETMCSLFQRLLTNYTVITANDGAKALGLYSTGERFNVIISDIRMPQLDGLTLLKEVKRISPDTEVILMTAYAEIGEAIKAMKSGAFDYLVKPFDSDEMLLTLEKALEIQELRSQKQRLQKELDSIKGFGPLVGQSEPMQKIYRFIDKASSSQAHVLITGESGTGKELVARSLHDRGLRQKGPFVALNCGALPIELAESELFGHIKGAFTGATMEKKGLFEEAQGGTLFLDEINSLPLPLQVKLNRAIEQNEARKVGSNKTYKIDVRLIAATNKDLQKEIQQGTFREDLYFRLHVLYLQMPSLREHKEDIFALVQHFLNQTQKTLQFSPEVLKAFLFYDWPGNIRELRNTVESVAVIANGDWINLTDLPPQIAQSSTQEKFPYEHLALLTYKDALKLAREHLVKQYFLALMKSFQGNVTLASTQAGIERETLHRLLKKYGVLPSEFRL